MVSTRRSQDIGQPPTTPSDAVRRSARIEHNTASPASGSISCGISRLSFNDPPSGARKKTPSTTKSLKRAFDDLEDSENEEVATGTPSKNHNVPKDRPASRSKNCRQTAAGEKNMSLSPDSEKEEFRSAPYSKNHIVPEDHPISCKSNNGLALHSAQMNSRSASMQDDMEAAVMVRL
ncbi:hypothetical protein M409DRAFT_16147 [Zasmidium cellare ATCC 36951]|uniref:Uncharacterized protein n=1 Tax=Zasmidium cellare ATCC 36951 TaxID=1080233 RepID=A0A6A6D634_ZASCE|nr:uncharacterized protein M409DRAFT_16147 [Zasmidium cellare ATCC 36951]KAF2173878.1 hypothetical protein M409DRAFT_16147 [Zasmidium cellare ATCC 36951]